MEMELIQLITQQKELYLHIVVKKSHQMEQRFLKLMSEKDNFQRIKTQCLKQNIKLESFKITLTLQKLL